METWENNRGALKLRNELQGNVSENVSLANTLTAQTGTHELLRVKPQLNLFKSSGFFFSDGLL